MTQTREAERSSEMLSPPQDMMGPRKDRFYRKQGAFLVHTITSIAGTYARGVRKKEERMKQLTRFQAPKYTFDIHEAG